MSEQLVEVVVFNGKHWNDPWPDDLGGFIEWAQAQLESVPAKYRSAAKIQITSEHEYDSDWAELTITYRRPETGPEQAQRKAREVSCAQQERARELKALRRLQAKYGITP